jgi:hypothetical protein
MTVATVAGYVPALGVANGVLLPVPDLLGDWLLA